MAKQTAKKQNNNLYEGLFVFKLALYLVLGSLWLKITNNSSLNLPVPLGLVVGLILASHEHFQIDRKIEYAVLLIAALVGFWVPFGLYVSF
jgi:hypothetical protein